MMICAGCNDDFADMQDIGTEKRVIDASDKSVREIADGLAG